jgi:GNAT superfamily N-acetyltransferase
MIAFRELDAAAARDGTLEEFYETLYVSQFPDPSERESLANMARYLHLKEQGWYGDNDYHLLVMESGGRAIGGSVSDYLAGPNAGVIEFLFTAPTHRGRGHGSMLMGATRRLLARDAASAGKRLEAIVAEVNDPFHRFEMTDSMDPFERALVWASWGFAKAEFPYVQPALSHRQAPVTGLMLAVDLLRQGRGGSVRSRWLLRVVHEYMRWAMRIEHPSKTREYRAMAAFAAAHPSTALTELGAYVGKDRARPLRIEPLDAAHPEFEPVMALLRRELPFPGRVASPREFVRALARRPGPAYRYHLWAVATARSKRARGIASFFTLARCGFGGYVAFDRRLRGRGYLRPLIARIEERMIKDSTGANGWFIECDPHSRAAFVACGFVDLPVDYRPPTVGDGSSRGECERLHLLYKPFGSPVATRAPDRRAVLGCVADILRHVYRVRDPERHDCYRQLARSVKAPRSRPRVEGR